MNIKNSSDDGAVATAFRTRALAIVLFGAAFSLAIGVYFSVYGESSRREGDAANDSYSYSALGHRAFVELLHRMEVPVTVSRFQSERKAGENAALILLEPNPGSGDADKLQFRRMVHEPEAVLVVLPKRRGIRDPQKPEWIERANLVGEREIDQVLNAISDDIVYKRFHAEDPPPEFTINELGVKPEVQEMQYIISQSLRPLVACAEGMLLGEGERAAGGRILVLSDPDILANHGLDDGDNAKFAAAIIERLRTPGRSIILDETEHGFLEPPSIWRELLRFPLNLIFIQCALLLGLVLWTAAGRFGDPKRAAAAIPPGKRVLIRNTADLLESAGHDHESLRRYWKYSVEEIVQSTRARQQNAEEQHAWLDRASRERGCADNYNSLEELIQSFSILNSSTIPHVFQRSARRKAIRDAALRIHLWKKEFLHGSQNDRRNGRTPARSDAPGRDRAAAGR